MSCGPLQKLLSRIGYENHTKEVFCTRSKNGFRKSVLTFRIQDLIDFEVVCKGFWSTLQNVLKSSFNRLEIVWGGYG